MTILPHSLLVAARPARWWSAFARYTIGVARRSGRCRHHRRVGPDRPRLSPDRLRKRRPAARLRHGRRERGEHLRAAGALPRRIRAEPLLSFRSHARRAFAYWNITFVALLALAFVTRALEDYSRASMILFYAMGLPAVVLVRYALVSTVILGSKVGLVTAQRVFLIGTGDDIGAFVRRYQPWNFGLHTVGAAPLSPPERVRLAGTAARGARRRPAPRDRHGANTASRRGLHRDALVGDRDDRRVRRRVPEHPGRDPSRPRAHPRPF